MKDTEIAGLQNPTGKEVLYSTYQNIGKSRNASLSGYVNWNATSNTRIYANLYGNYTYMEGANGLKNDGWNLFAYGGAQQSLPHDWRISLNVYGQTPWIMLQGKGSSFFDYGLSVNKSFLNKRLTLSAFASNFFKKYTSVDIGRGLMISDVLFTLCAFFVFDVKTGLYSLLGLIMRSALIDNFIESLNRSKYFHVVCSDPKPICNFIEKNLVRGATIVNAKAHYGDTIHLIPLDRCF